MATSREGSTPQQVNDALSELGVQLSLLNHHLSSRLELRAVDLDCLNLVHRHGPFSIGELARRVGLRPATTTGIVDRLEAGGWVVRERLEHDRRTVRVRALPDREDELFALLEGMGEHLDRILARYGEAELNVVVDFLTWAAAAAEETSTALGPGRPSV